MLVAGSVALVVALPALQVKVIRRKIPGMQLFPSRWLPHRQQVNSQRCYNGACDLILSLEDVIKLAIVGFRPYVVAIVDANQLGGEAKGVASLRSTTFQYLD